MGKTAREGNELGNVINIFLRFFSQSLAFLIKRRREAINGIDATKSYLRQRKR